PVVWQRTMMKGVWRISSMKTTRNWRKRHLELDALLLSLFTFLLLPTVIGAAPSRLKTRNVFLIVSDGFRWQEVFNGAEEALMAKTNGGVEHVKAVRGGPSRAPR